MLKDIESRLESQFSVKTVIDFSAIDKKSQGPTLMLYVLPLGEHVSNTEYTGVTVSKVTHQIGVVIALRNMRDAQGGEHKLRIEVERKKIRALLAGWVPAESYEPLTRGHGRLMQFKNNTVYWLDLFETKNTEQAQHKS